MSDAHGFRAQANPYPVRALVGFTHGLAAWDYPEVVANGQQLVAPTILGAGWINPDMLRDGLVLAKLETGDRPGARKVFDALTRRSGRDATDLRSMLLSAYVTDTTGALFRR